MFKALAVSEKQPEPVIEYKHLKHFI